jgi:hypothetical protein
MRDKFIYLHDDGVNIQSINFNTTLTYNTANCWYLKLKKYIFINIAFNGEPIHFTSPLIVSDIPKAYSDYNFILPVVIISSSQTYTNISCRVFGTTIYLNDYSVVNLPNNINSVVLSGVYISA